MIRVLVVDDDRMARQGLILTLPWADFGMEVVGEASHGKAALATLETLEVDLVITDLAMPLVTGIELMKAAVKRWPRLRFVVLSFHQDFPLVQEALRLGAIDYIAKQDLEKEQIDVVLGRIRDRFIGSVQESSPIQTDDTLPRCPVNEAWLYLRTTGTGPFAPPPQQANVLTPDLALVPGSSAADPGPKPGWGRVWLVGILHEPFHRIANVGTGYIQGAWFYDRDAGGPTHQTWSEWNSGSDRNWDPVVDSFRSRFFDFAWVVDDEADQRLRSDLGAARIPPRSLVTLLTVVRELWFRIYGHNGSDSLPSLESRGSWGEVNAWLVGFRANIREDRSNPRYPPHIQAAVMRAIHILHSRFEAVLTVDEVALEVNMSRSHFADCFRSITGKTFHDFQKTVRMDKAKELLATTDILVYQVGEMVGYRDEKYFSRQFKSTFGVLPQDFRGGRGNAKRNGEVSPE